MSAGKESAHTWDQLLIARMSYADYGGHAAHSFLVEVVFDYKSPPDPFSDYRARFSIRRALQHRTIPVTTHAADGVAQVAREYRLGDEQAVFNGASVLARVPVVGVDDQGLSAGRTGCRAYASVDLGILGFRPRWAPLRPGNRVGLTHRRSQDPGRLHRKPRAVRPQATHTRPSTQPTPQSSRPSRSRSPLSNSRMMAGHSVDTSRNDRESNHNAKPGEGNHRFQHPRRQQR